MTDETYTSVRYLDVQIQQNFSPTPGGKAITTELRIPIFQLQQGIAMLELVYNVDPRNIIGMTVYRVSKIYGRNRYDFAVVRDILPDETKNVIAFYLKYNRKKYIK